MALWLFMYPLYRMNILLPDSSVLDRNIKF